MNFDKGNDNLTSIISSDFFVEDSSISKKSSEEYSSNPQLIKEESDSFRKDFKIKRWGGINMKEEELEEILKEKKDSKIEDKEEEIEVESITKIDITRERAQLNFTDKNFASENLKALNEKQNESTILEKNDLLGPKTRFHSENNLSLHSFFYYKNMLIMNEEFNNELFEVFEPETDADQLVRQETKKNGSFFGLDRILLDSESIKPPEYLRDRLISSIV